MSSHRCFFFSDIIFPCLKPFINWSLLARPGITSIQFYFCDVVHLRSVGIFLKHLYLKIFVSIFIILSFSDSTFQRSLDISFLNVRVMKNVKKSRAYNQFLRQNQTQMWSLISKTLLEMTVRDPISSVQRNYYKFSNNIIIVCPVSLTHFLTVSQVAQRNLQTFSKPRVRTVLHWRSQQIVVLHIV